MLNRPSLTSGFGLRSLGQASYEAQRAEAHQEGRDFYRQNPDAKFSNPVAAFKATMPLPGNVADVAGMQAFFGLLPRNVRMSGGASAPDSNQIRGNNAGAGGDKRDYPAGVTGLGTFDTSQGRSLHNDPNTIAAVQALMKARRFR